MLIWSRKNCENTVKKKKKKIRNPNPIPLISVRLEQVPTLAENNIHITPNTILLKNLLHKANFNLTRQQEHLTFILLLGCASLLLFSSSSSVLCCSHCCASQGSELLVPSFTPLPLQGCPFLLLATQSCPPHTTLPSEVREAFSPPCHHLCHNLASPSLLLLLLPSILTTLLVAMLEQSHSSYI